MARRARRIAVVAGVGVVSAAAVAAAGFAVVSLSGTTDRALREREPPSPVAAAASPTASPDPTVLGTEAATTVRPKPAPEPVLEPGDTGVKVRQLQGRLSQLAWFTPPMSGRYDHVTRGGVRGFQAKRGLPASGVVDPRTWRRLVTMTRMPSDDEMFNRAGPPLFQAGDESHAVRVVQARLRQIAWFSGDVSDRYGDQTVAAVRGFQGKRHVPVTGKVDRRTLDLLVAMTSVPTASDLANKAPDPADGAALDSRCRTGRVLCIDKTSSSLRWVVDGTVRSTLDVRFGSEYTPTREGVFSVYWKDQDHVSDLFGSAMPYSMFFSRGQAVHYSSDFAARGYAGASHGCVNVRDYAGLASLFGQVATGDRVVVYRS
jgi:peptidoglycan hydrolase-like protein with peptidoglycan-binding domain